MPTIDDRLEKLEAQGDRLEQRENKAAQDRARNRSKVHNTRIGMIKSAGILDLPNREFREFLVEYAKSKARRDAGSKSSQPLHAIAAE